MERSRRATNVPLNLDQHASTGSPGEARREAVLTTAVGASYAFDPGVDGLASIYAARVLERGIDPRALCAEIRADRLGVIDRGPHRRALLARTRTSRFGRGTAAHLHMQGSVGPRPEAIAATPRKRTDQPTRRPAGQRPGFPINWSRKLAAAGLAVLLLLPIAVITAGA